MSEQTPDSAHDFEGDYMTGSSDEAEPSMEDILASIRKIISEDADPVPLDGPVGGTEMVSETRDDLSSRTEPLDFPVERAMSDTPEATIEAPTGDGLSSLLSDDAPVLSSPSSDDGDDVLDIDALLGDIDLAEPELPPLSIPDLEMDDEPVALEIPMIPDDVPEKTPEISNEGEGDITASADDDNESDEAFFNRILGTDEADASDKDDHDPLIDMLLSQDLTSPESGIAHSEGADIDMPDFDGVSYQDEPVDEAMSAPASEGRSVIESGEDLDLVKTLMADLTDADETDPVAAISDDTADNTILNDILDMAMEDEMSRGPALDAPDQSDVTEIEMADHEAMDVQALAEDLIVRSDVEAQEPVEPEASVADHPDPDFSDIEDLLESVREDRADATLPDGDHSLADIAAAVEADAAAAETRLNALSGRAATAGAIATSAATVTSEDDPEDDVSLTASSDDEMSPSIPETDHPTVRSALTIPDASGPENRAMQPQKENPMPSAVRKDVILDDVTEEATMSAFAELNNLVEERTILEERGPRIGDLVQEALKPMLKDWLDDNLQSIVERAVAKEVKRIANGK